jgi:hypothetical protein
MKQTAVEYLFYNLLDNPMSIEDVIYNENIIEQAKEMEKQQIIDAFKEGEDNVDNDGLIIDKSAAEQYYNETFKKK